MNYNIYINSNDKMSGKNNNAETIKLFDVVVPDIVKLLLIDSELVIIDELLFILSLYILYNPFKLFIII